jgi:hypothetical protein
MGFLVSVLIEYHRNDFIDIIREYIYVSSVCQVVIQNAYDGFFPVTFSPIIDSLELLVSIVISIVCISLPF